MAQEINFYGQVNNVQEFDSIKVNIASPEDIRSSSYGEVKKPETINYRTFNPENDGLFCAKIFGPVKDYECRCGKYRRMKYKGITCEKCGVEITTSRVRRDRMGHIELASPVVHIWFLKTIPSRISTLLDITLKKLERILYFENYVVIDPGVTLLKAGDLLSEREFADAQDEYGEDSFVAMMGAEAIEKLLKDIDLEVLKDLLREELANTNAEAKRKKITKRLNLVEDFLDSGNKPEWMVLRVLPVMPPELRPLVMLDGGRFASSDLNELYRRVINRNNRLSRLLELKAPEIIVRNEKRMLQESVDALFDNSKKGRVVKGSTKRPFKSLSDMLKGKQGRFRQNLLGKRVDYSGRSVIVVGPELKLHQCGIPKKMALELFKPFIYAKLEMYGIATTVKAAKKMVEQGKAEVWDILEEVIREHPVLLNRAPTLHRLGIQAFEPQLIEGKAISLHPLVCAAFNADFDGDQMAVHVPLSVEAQIEARVLMMSTNNILSSANGKPIIVPEEDTILGIYYLTLSIDNEPGEGMAFSKMYEVMQALHYKAITIHTKIKFRIKSNNKDSPYEIVETTPGRLMIYENIPVYADIKFELINKNMTKKEVSVLIDSVYRNCGQKATVIFADKLVGLGFKYATESGVSVGIEDMVVPNSKFEHINKTQEEIKVFEQQYSEGLITYKEKYNKAIDAWSHCTDQVSDDLMKKIARGYRLEEDISNQRKLNSVYMMAVSGARGSAAQIKQLAGMRGLMAKPSGEIIEKPITSNFKEGLTVLEYFNSTHGARKGLADTALKTANSGYLTRRLVDVAQDCVVTQADCNTENGIIIRPILDGGEVVVSISELVLGRTIIGNIYHPVTGDLIIEEGYLVDEVAAEKIERALVDSVKVRSVLTCEVEDGLCAKCYGRDLATGDQVAIGEAVGVVAAQSIGEPGTQLTMRTFHIGGTATRRAEASSIEAPYEAEVKIINENYVTNSEGQKIVMSRACEILLLDVKKQERARYKVPYGSIMLIKDGSKISQGDRLAEWDPHTLPIITEKSGKIEFQDIKEGVSLREVQDETTGITSKVITEQRQQTSKQQIRPRVHILDDEGNTIILANGLEAKYYIPVGAVLNASDGDNINAGDVIARIPRESSKTKDITGGLPRVAEIVEARKPKDNSIIVETDGRVEFGKDYRAKRKINIIGDDGEINSSYIIPKSKHIIVNEGDFVKKGDIIVDGSPVLQDILKVMGVEKLARYMVDEVQSVYRLQGVKIDDKHIEVIIRQMLQKVEINDTGDTTLQIGDKVNKWELAEINEKYAKKGLKGAKGELILQGITKASLQTRSFISAASFQDTTRVLTEAAIAGKSDKLRGLKENVIVGRLIPAGTGFYARIAKRQAQEKDKEYLVNSSSEEEHILDKKD